MTIFLPHGIDSDFDDEPDEEGRLFLGTPGAVLFLNDVTAHHVERGSLLSHTQQAVKNSKIRQAVRYV